MASRLVHITDVDKAWELWEAGLLVNEWGDAWGDKSGWWDFSDEELLERLPKWLAPKTGGGGYVYVETDEDC